MELATTSRPEVSEPGRSPGRAPLTWLRRHPVVWEVAAAAAAAILCLPQLAWGFGWDQTVFSNVADKMVHGGVLYRDAWEHKPPGVFYVFYLAYLLLGREIWAVRATEILSFALSAAALVRIGRRWFGSTAAGLVGAASLVLVYMVVFPGNSPQAETYQIPALLCALAVWPVGRDDARKGLRCFAGGALLSVAVLFKTPLAFTGLAALADRLWTDRREPTWRGKLGFAGLTLAGLVLPPLVLVAYYSARGAFYPLLDAWVTFPSHYAALSIKMSVAKHASRSMEWTGWLFSVLALMLLAVGFGRGLLLRRADALRWLLFMLSGWAAVIVQSKYFGYHHLPLLPVLAVGIGMGLSTAPSPPAKPSRWKGWLDQSLQIASAILVVLVLAQYGHAYIPRWSSVGTIARVKIPDGPLEDIPRNPTQEDVAQVLRSCTKPEDSIFIWGTQPEIYFLSNRRMAGPYCHLLQITPPWGNADRVFRLVERLVREKPRAVVVTAGEEWWGHREVRDLLNDYSEMREFIQDNYTRTYRVGEYDVWIRNS